MRIYNKKKILDNNNNNEITRITYISHHNPIIIHI